MPLQYSKEGRSFHSIVCFGNIYFDCHMTRLPFLVVEIEHNLLVDDAVIHNRTIGNEGRLIWMYKGVQQRFQSGCYDFGDDLIGYIT